MSKFKSLFPLFCGMVVTLNQDRKIHHQNNIFSSSSVNGCHGLTQQPATQHQTATRSPLPFPLSGMGRKTDKSKNSWIETKTV